MFQKIVWLVEDFGPKSDQRTIPIWTKTFDLDQKTKADDAYSSRPADNNVVRRKSLQAQKTLSLA